MATGHMMSRHVCIKPLIYLDGYGIDLNTCMLTAAFPGKPAGFLIGKYYYIQQCKNTCPIHGKRMYVAEI
jgi:hypothetical protein